MEDYEKALQGKNIAITGGLGFIGSNLARRLVTLNPGNLKIIDPLLPELGGNPFNIVGLEAHLEVYRNSIDDMRNHERMEMLMTDIDYVFNLAGSVSHIGSVEGPEFDLDINLRSHIAFLEACKRVVKKRGKKIKVVYAGTRDQYGKVPESELPSREDSPIREVADPQGMNKSAAEQYHLKYYKNFGIDAVSLRLTNTYGPRHQMKRPDGILNWFIRQAIDAQTLRVWDGGDILRDFNHIDDVVDAFLRVMSSEKATGQAYNLGSCLRKRGVYDYLCGNVTTIGKLAKSITELAGTGTFKDEPYPADKKVIEPGHFCADITKIHEELGWKPTIKLDDGIRDTIKFYREHREHYW